MRKPFSFPFIATIAFCTVVLVILVLFWITSSSNRSQIPSLPHEEVSSGVVSGNQDYLQIEITPQNVQNVIKELSRPSSYYMESQSTLYYDTRSSTALRRRWVSGELSRVDIFNTSGNISTHVLFNAKSAFYWHPGSSRVTELPLGEFTADDSQMLMVYEDILDLDPNNITDAKLTRYEGNDCIYVEVKEASLGYTERYWVSVSTGLLVLGQTLKNNTLIYSVQTLELDTENVENSIFNLPNGKFLGNV